MDKERERENLGWRGNEEGQKEKESFRKCQKKEEKVLGGEEG